MEPADEFEVVEDTPRAKPPSRRAAPVDDEGDRPRLQDRRRDEGEGDDPPPRSGRRRAERRGLRKANQEAVERADKEGRRRAFYVTVDRGRVFTISFESSGAFPPDDVSKTVTDSFTLL